MSSAFLGNITGIFELFECSKTSWEYTCEKCTQVCHFS